MASSLIEHALRKQHLSLTTSRRLLYDVLSNNEPLSMTELLDHLPNIDKTTVYRNVALFEKIGVAQRLPIGWKYKIELTNEFQDHHHHATCRLCGSTVALPEDHKLEARLHQLAAAQGFEPQNHQIEISGRCRNCCKT